MIRQLSFFLQQCPSADLGPLPMESLGLSATPTFKVEGASCHALIRDIERPFASAMGVCSHPIQYCSI
jgi:hypothetical protein